MGTKASMCSKIHGIDTHFILHDAKPNQVNNVKLQILIIDKKSESGLYPVRKQLNYNYQLIIYPDIDEMTYSSAQDWLSTVWNAGQHTAKPLVKPEMIGSLLDGMVI